MFLVDKSGGVVCGVDRFKSQQQGVVADKDGEWRLEGCKAELVSYVCRVF